MKCEKCQTETENRFCSRSCANSYSREQDKCGTKIVNCIDCGKEIEVDKRASSKQCKCINCKKDKTNNQFCLNCGEPVRLKIHKYCSKKCQMDFQYKQFIEDWKQLKKSGNISLKSELSISGYVKKYIKEKFENKCCKCDWAELNKFTNSVPLEIHHIDGNPQNTIEENLELICPNCHSLTQSHSTKKKNEIIGRRKFKKI